jgi:hypothetical protein
VSRDGGRVHIKECKEMTTKQKLADAFAQWDAAHEEAVAWKSYPEEQARLQALIDDAAARIAAVRDAAIAEFCAARRLRVSKREFTFAQLHAGTFESDELGQPPIPGSAIEYFVDGFRPAAIVLFTSWKWAKHVELADACELAVERLEPSWRHKRNTAAVYTRRVAS